MLKYRKRFEFLLDYLDENNYNINDSSKIIYLFERLYAGHKLAVWNCEYTLIMRHITTPALRDLFDKMANDHNYKLSLNKKKKVTDLPLQLRFDDSFLLTKTEQSAILDTKIFLVEEFDENGNYVGKPKKILSSVNLIENSPIENVRSTQMSAYIRGYRGRRIYEMGKCCMCSQLFDCGWMYTTDSRILYLCNNCKAKVRLGQFHNIIYTPMKG